MVSTTIKLPEDPAFIDNLILQRTGPFCALGGRDVLKRWFVSGEKSQLSQYLFDNQLLERYVSDTAAQINVDVDQFVALTAGRPRARLVSIGPGNGLFELLLYRRIGFEKVLLVDIEQTAIHQHGFAANGSGYASLAGTRAFLSQNGVDERCVATCNPQKEKPPQFAFDGLFSIISMGFHYPCDAYVEFIFNNAEPHGFLLLDKRKSPHRPAWTQLLRPRKIKPVKDKGFKTITKTFSIVDRVESNKYSRLLLARTEGAG